ncbi:hypothetical protein L0Y40_00170 [Candidatus Wolfebacteria bacterium]|nr:hypothetical protein [Candidatus Wolfebacteria bacterium]
MGSAKKPVFVIKGFIFSLGIGFLTALFSAIVFGILNVFLTGHGNYILEKDISLGMIGELVGFSGGLDDLILIILTFLSFVITLIFYTHLHQHSNPSHTSSKQ